MTDDDEFAKRILHLLGFCVVVAYTKGKSQIGFLIGEFHQHWNLASHGAAVTQYLTIKI